METQQTPTVISDCHSDDFNSIDSIDFEREFGAFDVASLCPGFDFVHDTFHGFLNILVNGFTGSPPITTCFLPPDFQNMAVRQTRENSRRSRLSIFYSLTVSAFRIIAQLVYQTSYAIFYSDLEILALLQHQLPFIFLVYCIYYGVEHYMAFLPKSVTQIPGTAMKLSFTKALNMLAHKLSMDTNPIIPFKQNSFSVASGANMFEIKYYIKDSVDAHCGPPFDGRNKFTMNAEITIHTFEMLPVVCKEGRAAYIKERLRETDLASKLVFPDRNDLPGNTWIDDFKKDF